METDQIDREMETEKLRCIIGRDDGDRKTETEMRKS